MKAIGATLLGLALVVQAQQPFYAQCGGNGWTGSTQCVAGACCSSINDWYYQCLSGNCMPSTTMTTTTATHTTSTSTSGATGSLPTSFRWSSTNALVGPKNDGRNLAGIKDPSIIEVDGTYHVFASTAQASGYNLVYFNFTDFNQAGNAPFFYLDQSGIGTGYRAAPQVFYFQPHQLWYLIFQNGNAAYSTNKDISNPAGWSAPKNFFSSVPSIITENIGKGYWVDMWVICDSSNCYLFSSDDNGHLYRSQTTLSNFPNGMGNTVIALSDSNPNNLFEASNVYRVGNEYLLLVEAIGSDGNRYFRSWTAPSLTGTWTGLANTEANPFARSNNVVFSGTAWTKSISHGEMVRSQVDQTMTISPCKLRYLYQGLSPTPTGDYNSLPWRLALLTQTNSALEVVEELLDEVYDRLGGYYRKQPGDDNAYINGRIGNHNVVVCCMPGMGKGNAASVASSLKISYPRISLALVVGICGGAPYPLSGEEIFLGDVIISDSVIQYDFGRQYSGGFEKKTGVKDSLGRPNKEIRAFLAALQTRRSRRDLQAKMLRHLQAIQRSNPEWHRPRSADDILFEASYQHKHFSPTSPICCCLGGKSRDVCKSALDTACIQLGCDKNRISRLRCNAENCIPSIHIGTVASADTVMKSGEHRDRLVKSDNVIGFEMEGAGVWDNTSCIIIKGVCDYADSHQNKAWQAYATATGAATAKAFLEYWVHTVREEANEFQVPLELSAFPAIEEFIGREDDLSRLWDYLQPTIPPTRKVAVLHGLGGIGKTQLAINFARKHKDDFTAVFWMSGKDRSANDEAKNEEEAEQRASQVLQWLALPGNTKWLIIFDNVDQYAPFPDCNTCGYDICEFFPTADHGSIIITTRLQRLTEVGRSFSIKKLTQEDAIQLLLQSSGFSAQGAAQVEAKDIMAIVDQLDGLSLAIALAGAFMRETGTSFKEYLQLYKDQWSELQSQAKPTRHYQQGNILETWTTSYQGIQKQDPTAATLLLLLAYFDNRDIWYELIRGGLNCSHTPPWFEAAVSNKLAFKARIKVLVDCSLVEPRQQEGSFTIHPVVQDWCFHIAASEERTVQLYELALVSVGYTVPRKDDREYAQLQQRLLPHADYVIQREKYSWLEDKVAVWRALSRLGNLYTNQGRLQEAEEMYQRALAGYEKALGPDHAKSCKLADDLASRASLSATQEMPDSMPSNPTAGQPRAVSTLQPSLPESLQKRHVFSRIFCRR
ncbi:hypothetical protein KXX26_005243 [Aspergillus fumigatus]|nr:hypothetical protein KXX26_005243 [Aspergillus fumigatus]